LAGEDNLDEVEPCGVEEDVPDACEEELEELWLELPDELKLPELCVELEDAPNAAALTRNVCNEMRIANRNTRKATTKLESRITHPLNPEACRQKWQSCHLRGWSTTVLA